MCFGLGCGLATCCVSKTCSCTGGISSGRVGYTINFIFFGVIAWIFRVWGKELMDKIPKYQLCQNNACYGVNAVYRICACLALFHLIHMLVMIGVKNHSDCRMGMQKGWWLLKTLLLVGVIVASFFIDIGDFTWFAYVAVIGASLFIVAQLLMLVDFAHNWAESWIDRFEKQDEEECKSWFWALFSSSMLLYCIGLTLCVLMFMFFATDGSACQLNIFLIVLNIIFCCAVSFFSVMPRVQEKNPRSGLLQASVISAYATYLVWSAMMSYPDQTCNQLSLGSKSIGGTTSEVSLLLGATFTIVALVYSTLRASSTVSGNLKSEVTPLNDDSKDEEAVIGEQDAEVGYNVSVFHTFFFLGALYLAMLMTDWSKFDKTSGDFKAVDFGMGAYWAKVISSWVCLLLYGWTLVGPVILPNRDWGYE
jgi:hypothetical protein